MDRAKTTLVTRHMHMNAEHTCATCCLESQGLLRASSGAGSHHFLKRNQDTQVVIQPVIIILKNKGFCKTKPIGALPGDSITVLYRT